MFPKTIGRLHLGERRSDGGRLCNWNHDVPVGHPLYWPEQISQYDDSDPCCIEHAIEQYVSEAGYGNSVIASSPVAEPVGEGLRDALEQCRDQFAFYTMEHSNTGKHKTWIVQGAPCQQCVGDRIRKQRLMYVPDPEGGPGKMVEI